MCRTVGEKHWTIGENQQILTKLKYLWCAYEGSMKKTTIFGLLQDLQWNGPNQLLDQTVLKWRYM